MEHGDGCPFSYRELPGGHMYLLDSPADLLCLIAADLHPGAEAEAVCVPVPDGPAGLEAP